MSDADRATDHAVSASSAIAEAERVVAEYNARRVEIVELRSKLLYWAEVIRKALSHGPGRPVSRSSDGGQETARGFVRGLASQTSEFAVLDVIMMGQSLDTPIGESSMRAAVCRMARDGELLRLGYGMYRFAATRDGGAK